MSFLRINISKEFISLRLHLGTGVGTNSNGIVKVHLIDTNMCVSCAKKISIYYIDIYNKIFNAVSN